MPVPTEYLRRECEFNLEARCDNCPHSKILQELVDKRLPPCNKCEVKQ